jgi:uncharacterized membrane protein
MQTMTDRVLQSATIASAVGALVVAGVFFAFSNFVMPALARLPAERAVSAMNMINITVLNAGFMTLLFGTALLGMGLTGVSIFRAERINDWPLLVATCVYIAGCIGVTLAGNVPLNDALATSVGSSIAATDQWHRYLLEWTRWNTVRSVASCVSGVMFIAAALR